MWTAQTGSQVFLRAPDGGLLVWGHNIRGELGLGNCEKLVPAQVPWRGPPVRFIVGGCTYSLLLDQEGGVWMTGSYSSGLGCDTFTKVPGLPPIIYIAASSLHARAVDEQGVVWIIPNSANTNSNRPEEAQQVTGFPPARRITCGNGFTIVETQDGALWAIGLNRYGQLGIPPGDDVALPELVPLPAAMKFPLRSLCAGLDFVAIVDHEGVTWTCGKPDQDSLGRAGDHRLAQVEGLPPMTSLIVGSRHCLGMSEDGAVWGWGENSHSQLVGREGHLGRPAQLALPDIEVAGVRAGSFSSFVIAHDCSVYTSNNMPGIQAPLGPTGVWTRLSAQFTPKSRAKSARSTTPC